MARQQSTLQQSAHTHIHTHTFTQAERKTGQHSAESSESVKPRNNKTNTQSLTSEQCLQALRQTKKGAMLRRTRMQINVHRALDHSIPARSGVNDVTINSAWSLAARHTDRRKATHPQTNKDAPTNDTNGKNKKTFVRRSAEKRALTAQGSTQSTAQRSTRRHVFGEAPAPGFAASAPRPARGAHRLTSCWCPRTSNHTRRRNQNMHSYVRTFCRRLSAILLFPCYAHT